MKTKNIFKTLAFAMMMPAMLLTTACSSEDELANNKNIDNTETAINKGFSLPVTVNVPMQKLTVLPARWIMFLLPENSAARFIPRVRMRALSMTF